MKLSIIFILLTLVLVVGCVQETVKSEINIEEAIEIAENSECVEEGALTQEYMYNNVTKTWWIDLDLEKPGCNPACVVREDTKTASINWRCTGVIVTE